MTSRPRLRRPAALGAVTALALTLGGLTTSAEAHHAQPPGPVNAANTYGWGKHVWQDDFVGPRKGIWTVSAAGAGNVRTQHGMLTLNTGRTGSVSATLEGAGHSVGRWEIRLRSRQYSATAASYRVRTELVPAAGAPRTAAPATSRSSPTGSAPTARTSTSATCRTRSSPPTTG